MKSILSFIINSTLLLLFIGLLTLPTYVTGFLVVNPSNLDLGSVAGVKSTAQKSFSVFPNLTDFDGYVAFNPLGFLNGRYQDEVTVTTFRNQIAIYSTLYTIYNDSDDQLNFKLSLKELPWQDFSFQKIIITLQKGERAHSTALMQKEEVGSTLLEVAEPEVVGESAQVLIGDELLQILARSGSALVTTPLQQVHEAGQAVYPEAVVVSHGELLSNQTQTVVLGPNEKAIVNLVVVGSPDFNLSTHQIPLQISITAVKDSL